MTLDEAIKHCEQVAEERDKLCKRYDDASGYSRSHNESVRVDDAKRCEKCAKEHRQLAEWLRELKQLRQQATEERKEEPCEDAVSRKAAKDKLKAICKKYCISYEDGERKPSTGGSAFALGHAFDDLPPVTPTQRWIPVSEEYPKIEDEYKYFLVTDDKGKVSVQKFLLSLDEEPQPYFSGMVNVIAWMPLPKPYKAEIKCKNCEYYTDAEEIHGVTPCGSCGVARKNFKQKRQQA